MALQCFVPKRFNTASRLVIYQANTIIQEYVRQGFDLTLRQLYYQFVARGLIANKIQEYKRLGAIVNDARLAGLIDWNHLTDRTRNLEALPHWATPGSIVEECARSFRIDKWATQKVRIEVWVEKEALAGVMERPCVAEDVPYFPNRGYVSQSEMYAAGQRMLNYMEAGQRPIVLHFGDHDPSGIDMTRDIQERLRMFTGGVEVRRLALNMDQVEEYSPPPNPAKQTDSRFESYTEEYGDESWELDALDPTTLAGLVQAEIRRFRDERKWREAVKVETQYRAELTAASDRWSDVAQYLTYHREDDE